MTRKESEKDAERPHYYSQFWLDIAAGRRTIGGPRPNEDGELLEEVPEPIALRTPLRGRQEETDNEPSDGYIDSRSEGITPSVDEPASEEYLEPEEEEEDVISDYNEDLDSQDSTVEEADIPDMDLSSPDEDEESEEENEELFDEDEEDEEDEDWVGGRGRKKGKPSRPTKQPKRPKRETRRGF